MHGAQPSLLCVVRTRITEEQLQCCGELASCQFDWLLRVLAYAFLISPFEKFGQRKTTVLDGDRFSTMDYTYRSPSQQYKNNGEFRTAQRCCVKTKNDLRSRARTRTHVTSRAVKISPNTSNDPHGDTVIFQRLPIHNFCLVPTRLTARCLLFREGTGESAIL